MINTAQSSFSRASKKVGSRILATVVWINMKCDVIISRTFSLISCLLDCHQDTFQEQACINNIYYPSEYIKWTKQAVSMEEPENAANLL